MKMTIKFRMERETKGAVRYEEINAKDEAVEMADAKIGTLYVRKSAMGSEGIPTTLKVTIE